tara:strand:+ start:353 stop:472 length:120 start_codon:yes stop_codon:yes gene_type:complete
MSSDFEIAFGTILKSLCGVPGGGELFSTISATNIVELLD